MSGRAARTTATRAGPGHRGNDPVCDQLARRPGGRARHRARAVPGNSRADAGGAPAAGRCGTGDPSRDVPPRPARGPVALGSRYGDLPAGPRNRRGSGPRRGRQRKPRRQRKRFSRTRPHTGRGGLRQAAGREWLSPVRPERLRHGSAGPSGPASNGASRIRSRSASDCRCSAFRPVSSACSLLSSASSAASTRSRPSLVSDTSTPRLS